jgi:chemotaxis protein methyltransferase CheR
MDAPVTQEIESFSALVAARLGFRVGDHNFQQIDEILRRRLRRTGCGSAPLYLERLNEPFFLQEELRELAAELSVAETYFFRHPEQFQALVEVAIPARVRARSNTRQLRILSAGCASGEEAYSLAAVIRTTLPEGDEWDIRILGIDANHRLLKKAAEARYGSWSLRSMSEAERLQHFHHEGKQYVLKADTRALVQFEERNLLEDDPSFWQPGLFDIIFWRNVMIYFTPAATQQVVGRLTDCLAPGGFLFLGPSETLRGITQDFHLRHTHGAFYYQRKHPGETPQNSAALQCGIPSPPVSAANNLRSVPAAGSSKKVDPAWMTSISYAADRIAALAEQSRRKSQEAPCGADVGPQETPGGGVAEHPLEPVRTLLRQERFEDALRELRALPPDSESDPDALLLAAVLLANTGEIPKAREICQRLLAVDEMNAGAHYLMAVCCEHSRDYRTAAEQDEQAIYLDPDFAMPRMHLGLMAKRLGDHSTAQRELREALRLLTRESSSRILLFGGGFSREALVQFCRSQLRRSGEAS